MCFWTRIAKCAETMMMNQYPCGRFVVNKGGYKLVTKPPENRSESRDQKLNIRALYYNTNFASAAAVSPRREKVRRRVLMWIKSRSSLHNILRDRTEDQWQMRVASRENGPASTRIGCARWCRCNFPLVIIRLKEKVRVRRRYGGEIDVTFLLNLLDHWIILLGSKKKKEECVVMMPKSHQGQSDVAAAGSPSWQCAWKIVKSMGIGTWVTSKVENIILRSN